MIYTSNHMGERNMKLTPQHKRFFDDFGYIFLPGLLAV